MAGLSACREPATVAGARVGHSCVARSVRTAGTSG